MPKKDVVERSGAVLRWLQTAIAVVVTIAGFGVNWGILTTELESLHQEQEYSRTEMNKMKDAILSLQLDRATNEQRIVNIKELLDKLEDNIKPNR